MVLDFIPLGEIKRVHSRAKGNGKASLRGLVEDRLRKSAAWTLSASLEPSESHQAASNFEDNDDCDSDGWESDHEDDRVRSFAIKTIDDGTNAGKTTVLRASSPAECQARPVDGTGHSAPRWRRGAERGLSEQIRRVAGYAKYSTVC